MMKLEGGKISSLELALLVISFNLGTTLILNPGSAIGRDAWLAALAGMGEGLVFVWIVLTLAARFKNRTLIQINDLIFGSYVGKAISLLYLWYFLHMGSIALRNYADFFTTTIYTETPVIVFQIMLVLVSAWTVHNGLEVLVRCSTFLVPLVLLAVILDTFLLLKDMELTNLLPILDVSWGKFFQASHSVAVFPFGDIIVFLMILPFTNAQKKNRMVVILAIIVSGLFLTLVVARNTAVLGSTVDIQAYPSFPAIRLINIAKFLTRLEIIIAVNLLAMGFIKGTILYYSTVLGLAQLLKLRSYLPLVLPLGAIFVSLGILMFESNVESLMLTKELFLYYKLLFQLILPLLFLIVAVIRGVPEKGKGV